MGTDIYKEKTFTTFLSLAYQELRKFLNSSQNKSNGGCLRGMLYILSTPCFNIRCTLSLYISAWAISALLVQATVGNAKAFDMWDE